MALLAVVGLASTMRFDGGQSLSTSELAFVVMLVAVVAALAVGVGTAAVGGAYAASGDNRGKIVAALMLAALLGAVMALLFMSSETAVDGVGGAGERRRPREPVADDYFGLSDHVFAGIAAAVIAAVALLAVAFVALGAVGAAQRRREDVEPPVDEEEAVMQAVDESLDDLRSEREVRRAIIACYARMERALQYAGSGRRPAEAPFEYLVRVLERITANAPAARSLTELFERAKFSTEPMGESEKQQAIEALEVLRAELRTA